MRSSWLYFAIRSERDSEPVLICPAFALGHRDRGESLRQRADLIDLDEDRVRDPLRDPLLQDLRVRDEEIVADELHFPAQTIGKKLPALPVVLRHPVFDTDDRIAVAP